MSAQALSIRIRGQVQGVGFRPFVWQLAQEFGLQGRVLNDPEGVLIEASGDRLGAFIQVLPDRIPPLARLDALETQPYSGPLPSGFEIAASRGTGAETRVTPDAATCPACADEIRGSGRREGYAFTNCTHCGPRFTILQGLPYDRAKTTMAPFAMCPACRAEYENPADRRFHAQPVACPDCGPRIWLETKLELVETDVIQHAASLLKSGEIIAIKGLGGFHLACDATNPAAISTLRNRKYRPAKPFALMIPLSAVPNVVDSTEADLELLQTPAAPIVLMRSLNRLPEILAPGMDTLGVMLPYTPLHHLLLKAVGRPLVMTSGNLSGEPQVIGNDEARQKLSDFADAFLMHDREIARRLDDSVERATPPMILRRARGRVPGTLPLPKGFEAAPQVLALGGQMKGALCLIKNGQALLGHHLGDMDDSLTWDAFLAAEADYTALFDHNPSVLAVDLHLDFRASRYGAERAEAKGLKLENIQHHHAHLAACLGENGWPLQGGKVAGIILDGTGLGPDGTVWGGEVLIGDYCTAERFGGLMAAPLAGGDRAAREPWRNALARLDAAGLADWADSLFPNAPRQLIRQAIAKGLNAPLSSSAGRLFEAVAAILGICPSGQTYEGEAAMRLEAMVEKNIHEGYAFDLSAGRIDPAPIWKQIQDNLLYGVPLPRISTRFHYGLANAFATIASGLVTTGKAQAVVLSGGCFQNAALLEMTLQGLEGIPTMIHRTTPAGDGGLALGQALIAAARSITQAETH